jgi:hypothetical protein
MWKMDVVEGLIHGRDGIVRAVTLQNKNGFTNRPISKLYPINVNEHQLQVQLGPNRAAKRKAMEKISINVISNELYYVLCSFSKCFCNYHSGARSVMN